jgi:hypothetical protein
MSESKHDSAADPSEDERVEQIVREGPHGALMVVGIATAIVVAIWFAFYFFVFMPRGVIH